MLKFAVVISTTILVSAGAVMAQSNMGTDSSGRFDGSMPYGTGPQEESGSFSIPLDSGTTASTSSDIVVVQPERCREIRRGAIRGTRDERSACLARR